MFVVTMMVLHGAQAQSQLFNNTRPQYDALQQIYGALKFGEHCLLFGGVGVRIAEEVSIQVAPKWRHLCRVNLTTKWIAIKTLCYATAIRV